MARFANSGYMWGSRNSKPATSKRCSTMATAVCGSATRAASDEFCGFVKINTVAGSDVVLIGRQPCLCQTMSDRLVAATKTPPTANRQPPTASPDHQSLLTTHGVLYLTGLNRRRGFESPQVAARVPPPEFEHAVILECLPAKSAPFADQ